MVLNLGASTYAWGTYVCDLHSVLKDINMSYLQAAAVCSGCHDPLHAHTENQQKQSRQNEKYDKVHTSPGKELGSMQSLTPNEHQLPSCVCKCSLAWPKHHMVASISTHTAPAES